MDNGRRKGPICGVENCRSRLYDEGEDGYRYCENGHRKGDLVVGLDEDNFTSEARVRTRKKQDREEKEHQYYKGQQAYDLYLKSLQHILRHQVWFLVHEKGLPVELETVIFDLWTLRILQLEGKVATERLGYDSQTQAFSTSESDSEYERKVLKSVRGKKLNATPTLLDTLALCYLGMITLRLPITVGDIHRWSTEGKMPYKRAIKHIPPAMKDRLPSQYHGPLDPNGVLKLKRLHSSIMALEVSFQKEHGITWPSLNHPLLLFRYLKELALPLELYDTTIRLASMLKYDFVLHTTDKTKLGLSHHPEAQLLACLVVCVKLIYPFDGERRYPRTTQEPAATAMDWDGWYTAITSAKTDKSDGVLEISIEEMTNTEEKDVFSMTEFQMDQYMDWYQDSFIDESACRQEDHGEFRNALYSMFPIDTKLPPNSTTTDADEKLADLELVKTVHGAFESRQAIREGEEDQRTIRPGQSYQFYKKEKDLPQPARQFYKEAARVAGLSVEMLTLAVFFAERGVEKWRKKQAQRENGDAEA